MSVTSRRTDVASGDERAEGSSTRSVESKALTLNVWPPRNEPKTAAVVAGAIVLLAVVSGLVTGNWAAAVLVVAALALATWRTFVAVTFVFDASGIEQRVGFLRRRIAWAAVARCEIWPDGVRLFRSASVHPLDGLRSLFIPWRGQRNAILALLTRRALRARVVDLSGHAPVPSTVSEPNLDASATRFVEGGIGGGGVGGERDS